MLDRSFSLPLGLQPTKGSLSILGLSGALPLRSGEFIDHSDIGGVSVVLLQHCNGRSHILREDIVIDACLKPRSGIGMAEGIERPLLAEGVFGQLDLLEEGGV